MNTLIGLLIFSLIEIACGIVVCKHSESSTIGPIMIGAGAFVMVVTIYIAAIIFATGFCRGV